MIEKHIYDVWFNNKSLADFGVHVNGNKTFDGPEIDYETIEIPGRNGDLHVYNGRYKNVDLTYRAFIAGDNSLHEADSKRNFSVRMRQLRAYLMSQIGYKRLEDTYHPDEFRKAVFKGRIETDAINLMAGEFDLEFSCMPQRFLKSGEKVKTFNTHGIIENPTSYTAKPLVRIYGKGNLTINGIGITITNSCPYEYVDFDCEIQDAFYGLNNCNPYITLYDGEFYTLSSGVNDIIFGSGVTKAEITPRWWVL